MKLDRFDKILISLLILALFGFALLAVRGFPEKTTAIETRNMEKELAAQSRLAMLDKLFAPVTAAMQAGQYQEALLKLEEVNVRYPGEAHGFILKGEIFDKMGVTDKAAASFVQGVKLNGDYIDRRSPVSRRDLIARIVNSALPGAAASYRSAPGNGALKENLANLNYLKSRLAGGCE
jgi:tetratricopeptide (TPR) repeat protein